MVRQGLGGPSAGSCAGYRGTLGTCGENHCPTRRATISYAAIKLPGLWIRVLRQIPSHPPKPLSSMPGGIYFTPKISHHNYR